MNKKLCFGLAFGIVAMFLFAGVVSAIWNQGYGQSRWKEVSDDGAPLMSFPNGQNMVEASNGSKYLVLDKNDTTDDFRVLEVYRSTDGGRSWSLRTNLSNSSQELDNAVLAIDSLGVLHFAYIKDVDVGTYRGRLMYRNLSNDGWGTETSLSNATGINASFPSIAVDDTDTVHIVWQAINTSNPDHGCIVYTNSSSFSSQTPIKGGWDSSELGGEYKDSYLYPCIIQETYNSYVSYHYHNATSGLYMAGIVGYNGTSTDPHLLGAGWTNSRNPTISFCNSTHIGMVFKGYGGVGTFSNLSYVSIPLANLSRVTDCYELANYSNEGVYIYPSIASYSGRNLVHNTPFLAGGYSNHTWYITRVNGSVLRSGKNSYSASNLRVYVFAKARYSRYNNPSRGNGDTAFLYAEVVGDPSEWYLSGNVDTARGSSYPSSGISDEVWGVFSTWLSIVFVVFFVVVLFGLLGYSFQRGSKL